MSIRDLLAREPVRVRVYGFAAALTAVGIQRGYLDGLSAEVVLSGVALVLAVESARAKVSPSTTKDTDTSDAS